VLADVADDLLLHLAALDDQQGGDAANVVTHGSSAVTVNVHLGNLNLIFVGIGDFVDDGRESAAGAAPGSPEIDEHGLVGLEHVGVEVRVRDFQNCVACHYSSGAISAYGIIVALHWMPRQRRSRKGRAVGLRLSANVLTRTSPPAFSGYQARLVPYRRKA